MITIEEYERKEAEAASWRARNAETSLVPDELDDETAERLHNSLHAMKRLPDVWRSLMSIKGEAMISVPLGENTQAMLSFFGTRAGVVVSDRNRIICYL